MNTLVISKGDLRQSNIRFIRHKITKSKWQELNDLTPIKICSHPNLKGWDCGCSFGCDCCSYSYHCPDCNIKLTYHQRDLVSVEPIFK